MDYNNKCSYNRLSRALEVTTIRIFALDTICPKAVGNAFWVFKAKQKIGLTNTPFLQT
jgi:hypothetical protein